jgi:predicted RND superfamily exporter protein
LLIILFIGIAVADTIHFLSELKFHLSKGENINNAITQPIVMKGKAIVLSSLILCMGVTFYKREKGKNGI